MKKSIYYLAAVAAMLLSFSCSREMDVVNDEESVTEGFLYNFHIADGAETKTTLDDVTVNWESGDKIGVFATGSTNKYGAISSLSPVVFPVYLASALSAGDKVYCYYPYNKDANDGKTADAISLTIPNSQTGDFDAMPQVSIPYETTSAMASGSNSVDDIYFCNLGSVVRFLVYSSTGAYDDETVTSIKFTANAPLAGNFTFDLTSVDYSDPSTLAISGYSSLWAQTTVSPAIGTSTSNAGVADLVIAPGTYYGTVLLITNKASYTYTLTEPNKITFARNKIKKIGLDLESANCTRELNGYEIPATINFKTGENVSLVWVTGADYYATNASYFFGSALKFDASNEQIIIPTKAAFGDISIVALYNTGSTPTSTLKVYGSANGVDYTLIGTPSFTHGANVVAAPDAVVLTNTDNTYRYIKMVFTKATGNLAVGSVSIAVPDTDPRISSDNITGVAAIGVVDAPSTYTVYNFVDDVEVSAVTGCVSEAIAMDGDIVYTVTPNYTGAERNGTIVLASAADPSVTKTINVSQVADVFSVSSSSVLVGKDASSTVTFTVTSTYGFTVASSNTGMFTVSPASCEGSTSPQTITVTAVTANSAAEKSLGTVTITRTVDDNDELEVAVNQQAGSATFSLVLSFPDENSANNKVNNYTSTKDYKITLSSTEYTWSIANFNNNTWSGGWSYIRGGIKSSKAGTEVTWNGSITTSTAITTAISKVVVDYQRITVGSGANVGVITEAKLEVSTSSTFDSISETVNGIPTELGEYTYTITSPVENAFYRLSYATSNKSTTAGVIQINSIAYNE